MFVIVNKETNRIHREPNRKSYASTSYKTLAAAKAGVTRTVKYYAKAVADVQETLARGEKEYMSRYYYDARDATTDTSEYGRGYDMRVVADGTGLEIKTLEEYGDPMVTRTGRSPYNSKEITVTISINDVNTHMDPLCESHYTR